jgi:hypothetical protein
MLFGESFRRPLLSILTPATFRTFLPNPGEFIKSIFNHLICGVQV